MFVAEPAEALTGATTRRKLPRSHQPRRFGSEQVTRRRGSVNPHKTLSMEFTLFRFDVNGPSDNG